MQRPVSQDETLDTNDVKNSSLQASNGKNMATLRAYDAIALEVGNQSTLKLLDIIYVKVNSNKLPIYFYMNDFLLISALHMRHYVTEKECSKSLRNSALALPSVCREFSTLNPVRLETLLPWIAAGGHK